MAKGRMTNPVLDPYERIIEGHKLRLAKEIVSRFKSWDLTQEVLAKQMGLNQARTSYLLNLKLEKFSLEMLIKLALHCDIGIKVMIRDEQ